MGINVETLAAAKKYAEKIAGSGGGSGGAISDGSIGTKQLSTEVNEKLNAADNHIDGTIPSDTGAHGLRYYNGALQYEDNGKWITINISELLI